MHWAPKLPRTRYTIQNRKLGTALEHALEKYRSLFRLPPGWWLGQIVFILSNILLLPGDLQGSRNNRQKQVRFAKVDLVRYRSHEGQHVDSVETLPA